MEKKSCLIEGCELGRYSRGLCQPHYSTVLAIVKKGKYSWKDFEEKGFSLPSTQPNRKSEVLRLMEK